MSNKEILEKAITKAIDGGWDMFKHGSQGKVPWYIVKGGQMPTPKVVEGWVPKDSLLICGIGMDHYYVWEHVIFNHDFAKAMWNKDMPRDEDYKTEDELQEAFNVWKDQPTWQYHLQQMVIAPDPIKYLGDNI